MSELQNELTSRQKTAGSVCAITAVVLCGVFLFLCGLHIIPLNLSAIWLSGVFTTVCLYFLAMGVIQKNPVSVWIGLAFFACALTGLLAVYTDVGYGSLYPIYIFAPAFASIITGILWRNLKPHLGAMVFFGVLAGIFSLQSFGLVGWIVVVPLLVAFVALGIAYAAFMAHRYRDE